MSNGSWRVMLVYACGVLSGSMAASVFDPTVYLAGASGGCYALVRYWYMYYYKGAFNNYVDKFLDCFD